MTAAEANRRITALASDPAVHRAFHWLHLHEAQFERWHRNLLAVPAPPFGEAPRAEWMAARFRELGLTSVHIDTEGNALAELPPVSAPDQSAPTLNASQSTAALNASQSAPALNASQSTAALNGSQSAPALNASQSAPALKGTGFSPSVPATEKNGASAPEGAGPDIPVILLSAHLDTVFPAGTVCTPREEGGKLFCPGATDNGAGLTALLAIAAALRHAQSEFQTAPPCTILFAANVGEEGDGNLRGMRHLFSSPPYATRIRSAIALEGCGAATVVDRALGIRRLRAEITGPGGHSWADAGRPSPITALAAALTALSKLSLPSNPRTTLNCGMISGGTSINSIPSTAQADFDLRSTSSEELESLEQLVLSTLSKYVKEEARRARERETPHTRDQTREALQTRETPQTREALQIKVLRIGDRAAGALASDSTLATSLRAVDRHLSLKTDSRIGSTDANLPLSLGIPALAIGAGGRGGGIHTFDEWYSPEGRELALRRILLLLLDTCSLMRESSTQPAAPQHLSS